MGPLRPKGREATRDTWAYSTKFWNIKHKEKFLNAFRERRAQASRVEGPYTRGCLRARSRRLQEPPSLHTCYSFVTVTLKASPLGRVGAHGLDRVGPGSRDVRLSGRGPAGGFPQPAAVPRAAPGNWHPTGRREALGRAPATGRPGVHLCPSPGSKPLLTGAGAGGMNTE